MKSVLFIIPAIAFALSFNFSANAADETPLKLNEGLSVGDKISPDSRFTVNEIDSTGKISPRSILDFDNGDQDFLVLDFMSINCSICIKNIPRLQLIQQSTQKYAAFRSVALDRDEEAVEEFFVKDGVNLLGFSVALDSGHFAARAFKIKGTPTMYILNRDLEIVYTHVGLLLIEDAKEIYMLLRGKE